MKQCKKCAYRKSRHCPILRYAHFLLCGIMENLSPGYESDGIIVKRVVFGTVLMVILLEFVLITAFAFFTPTGNRVLSAFSPTPTPTPMPVLTARGTPPVIAASAAYLLDADYDHTLMDMHGDQRLPMASTTKIMTAVLVLDKGNLNQLVTIQSDALNEVHENNGSTANLNVGDQIRMEDLLYALLLPSGDDAAIAIADAMSGSVPAFVQQMNSYAHQLKLNNTHFVNPDGLTYVLSNGQPDPNHYTTASDLAHLTHYAMQNPLFAQIVELQEYRLPATSTHQAYDWVTTNNLLRDYAGAIGIKTGYTVEAGYCLVFAAYSNGHHLIGVLLHDGDTGADQRFADAATLLDWGFQLPLLPPTLSPTPPA
jgi:D-alanyl-D-alanine carboxypeptidase (penicillin-binding protein 5/6)